MGRLQLVRGPSPDPEPTYTFARLPLAAWDDPRLSDRAFRVLFAIERHCWGDRRECWATNATLAGRSRRVSHDTIGRGLRELVDLGYIRVEPDPTKARGQRIVLLYRLKAKDPLE